MTAYAELQVTSNYSFLRGASHPDELMIQAAALGHRAIAITDRNSLAGVVRAHVAAKKAGIQLIVGTRLDLEDGPSLLCLPMDQAAYGRLSQLLTLGKRRVEKGSCSLRLSDLLVDNDFNCGAGHVIIVLAPETLDIGFHDQLQNLKSYIRKNLYLSVNRVYNGDDARRIHQIAGLAHQIGLPLVATNDVHAHSPTRRPLQDVLTAIREHCTVQEAGFRLFANGERHLKAPDEMARLFAAFPEAIENTARIADICTFSLDELAYDYPIDPTSDGRTPQEELIRLTEIGALERYPDGIPAKVRKQITP